MPVFSASWAEPMVAGQSEIIKGVLGNWSPELIPDEKSGTQTSHYSCGVICSRETSIAIDVERFRPEFVVWSAKPVCGVATRLLASLCMPPRVSRRRVALLALRWGTGIWTG